MNTFAERSERHANVLEVLCGHMAAVVDGAFHRVLKAELPEQKDQAALVFDRLARGLRLTVAMEARLHRDMARDAREIERFAAEPVMVAEVTSRTERSARTPTPYVETDHESEADYESGDASLDIHIKDLSDLLEEQSTTLDPQRRHRDGLARISDWWVRSQTAASVRPKRQWRRPGYPKADCPTAEPGRHSSG